MPGIIARRGQRRHRHRLGRPDRLRGGPPLRRPGPGRRRHRQRHARATSSAPRRRPPGACERLEQRAGRGVHATSTSTSATATRWPTLFARVRPRHRAGHPHRRAAVARLGRARAVHRLRRQRRRHAQPARGDPPALPRRAVHLHCSTNKVYGDTPERAAAGRAGDPVGDRPGAPVRSTASPRTCRSTPACTRSSARRRSPPT